LSGTPRLASGKLLMIDRITARHAGGGARGLGWWRAEKVVDAGEWFFKAHFFQDPVQPGSLGIEALGQLLQVAMIDRGLGDGAGPGARFEPLALGRPMIWKYRGQVTPANRIITTEMELVEVGEDARGRYAIGNGALWVDGVRIYRVERMAMRIVSLPG
jgi:3-hydroxymyristoyl/3-hydroxydecanoyl-(acyl carrier protein) dehydratase